MSTYIGMYGNRINELVVLPIEVVELIHPQVFNVPWVYPAVAIWRFLDELLEEVMVSRVTKVMGLVYRYAHHHRRKIIQIPRSRNLDQPSMDASFEWLHPMVRMLLVVDWNPFVAGAQEVGLAVMVRETVIVF